MTEALLFGVAASSPLVAGAILGMRWQPQPWILAVILAFAGGALVSALSFELFEEAFETAGTSTSSIGFVAGALVFVFADTQLDRHVAAAGGGAAGFALLAAVTLDGVPENIALGTTVADSGGSLALLAAIFASNLPEALVGARSMCESGRTPRFVIAIWTGAAVVLAAAVIAGGTLLEEASDRTLGVVLAFAGGAVLASLVDTVFPKAFKDGGPWVALATVAGFLLSFVLGS